MVDVITRFRAWLKRPQTIRTNQTMVITAVLQGLANAVGNQARQKRLKAIEDRLDELEGKRKVKVRL